MKTPTDRDHKDYQNAIDMAYEKVLGFGAKSTVHASLVPAILSDEEAQGFIDRYSVLRQFMAISQELFSETLVDDSKKPLRDLILNDTPSGFGLDYHQNIYRLPSSLPYFFRTDECIPGKISEIQYEGSLWGNVQVLQSTLAYMSQFAQFPLREFNSISIAQHVAEAIRSLTQDHPYVFHQIDESSNMLDMNYFIASIRQHGIKFLGHDYEVSLHNFSFIQTHSFLELVHSSCFADMMTRYEKNELVFNVFPSILFYQKIALAFPFWEKTRERYSDAIRDLFPYTSLVMHDVTVEGDRHMSLYDFANQPTHERDYFLKYAGANGTINWGSKAVYHLGKSHKNTCLMLLTMASEDFAKGSPWILQKAHHRKEQVTYSNSDVIESNPMYSKWSGFYGPKGFLGGHVMNRSFYKVHGQQDTVCRLLL